MLLSENNQDRHFIWGTHVFLCLEVCQASIYHHISNTEMPLLSDEDLSSLSSSNLKNIKNRQVSSPVNIGPIHWLYIGSFKGFFLICILGFTLIVIISTKALFIYQTQADVHYSYITESLNSWGWQTLLEIILSNSPTQAGPATTDFPWQSTWGLDSSKDEGSITSLGSNMPVWPPSKERTVFMHSD